jgi:hypothetical protein
MSTRAERAFAPFAYLPWQSPLLAAAATARPGCHDAPTLAGLQSGGAGQGTSRLQAAARGTANFPLVSSSPACPVADGDGFVIHPFPQKGWLGRPGPGEKLFPSIASLVGVEALFRRCSGPSPTSSSPPPFTGREEQQYSCRRQAPLPCQRRVQRCCCVLPAPHSRIQTQPAMRMRPAAAAAAAVHVHCLAIGMGRSHERHAATRPHTPLPSNRP